MMCTCMNPFTHTHAQAHTHTHTNINKQFKMLYGGGVSSGGGGVVWWGYSGYVRVSHNDVCMYEPIHTHAHASTHTNINNTHVF